MMALKTGTLIPRMSEDTLKVDLIVIGGGPAGVVGATTAASMGKKVALVEHHTELGGAGANTGTVPSKTLRETALALSGVRSRGLYGVDLSLRREVTVADFLRHEQHVKAGLNHTISQRMDASNTEVYCGSAAFADSHTVGVGGDKPVSLQGDYILVATGSAPARPPGFPFGCREIYDSDTILELDRLPGTMAVVGAGVIGSEYASTFAALGASVHLIDGHNALLPFLDAELSRALTAAMEKNGIRFHWGDRPGSYRQEESGKVTLTLESGEQLSVDAVLVASGRKSNTETLNLAAAGVTVGERGIIPVDASYRTNVPHIFAAGDVIGFPALASTSMQQARYAMRAAFNAAESTPPSRFLPTGVYTIPEVSMAGETEEALERAGVEYVAGRAPYSRSARGRIIGDTEGFLKLLFRRSDMRLLGVHAMGEQATELVHVGMIALITGASADLFDEACFNVPTLGTLYKVAAFEATLTVRR
jgi:NAD(P) transhydrogenase